MESNDFERFAQNLKKYRNDDTIYIDQNLSDVVRRELGNQLNVLVKAGFADEHRVHGPLGLPMVATLTDRGKELFSRV